MRQTPLVSILVSNYNYGRYIGQMIDSVLQQTYPNFELIICDDGSTDDSVVVVRGKMTKDDRVRLVEKDNGGQASGFNTCFELARGEVIVLQDSDDVMRPKRLEVVVEGLSGQCVGSFVHPLGAIDGAGRSFRVPTAPGSVESGMLAERVVLRGGDWVAPPTSGLAFKREVAEAIFPIPETLHVCADAFVSMMMPLLARVAATQEPLSDRRHHGSNLFAGRALEPTAMEEHCRLYEHVAEEVNNRLQRLGRGEPRIDVQRSLQLRQKRFLASALRGDPLRVLARQLPTLFPPLLTTDLHSLAGRSALVVLDVAALLIPASRRRHYLTVLNHALAGLKGWVARKKRKRAAGRARRTRGS